MQLNLPFMPQDRPTAPDLWIQTSKETRENITGKLAQLLINVIQANRDKISKGES
jgi:hypothetical protein